MVVILLPPSVSSLYRAYYFELDKLIDGDYQLRLGDPFWMPEVNLAIGRYQGHAVGIQQELLDWFNGQGNDPRRLG
ncbi:MAG: hypothetical protein KTR27_15745 [Leptolyngbyaceae cyanobacterium MAG.088]|nr:hypothetical protein [Leptolyngbyaceae cyanobacterium MAG.088]